MSYCVNCGVELDASAKKCVLCSTPVVNPNIQIPQETKKPFSDELIIPKTMQKKFIAFIITMILLIPNIVLFLVNVFFLSEQYWSLYVFATSVLLWALTVLPFYMKKPNPYVIWAVDSVVFLAYTCFFRMMGHAKAPVFYSVSGIILTVSLLTLILIIWLRTKKRDWSAVVIHILADSVLSSLISGCIVSVLADNMKFLVVGIIVALCSLSLLGFFIYCNHSRHMRAWLKRFFYV